MHNQIKRKLGGKINWHTAVSLSLFHLGALASLFVFSWKWVIASILLNWVAGSLGIGIGFHRLLTHRGFQTPRFVEYLLTFCGLVALEGGAINWVVTHRIHHAFTDKKGDPHSPRDGHWWAHLGWILKGTAQQHPEHVMRRYAPDLMKDAVHVWMNRFYFLPVTILGLGLLYLGGWPAVLWGVCFRLTFGLHATWLVNSATHIWGKRRFATNDDSTNSWWVALLTFGEGWHNNHHAFPRAARHGLKWYEVDLNWYVISFLKVLGLARSVKVVPRDQIIASDDYRLRKAA